MRKEFPGYFKLSDDEIETIWKNGLVVFDTNALLNLYRYTNTTREDLLSAIRTFGDRVRIPFQVADEFFRNRVTVISDQRKAYRDILTSIDAARTTITQAINKHDRRHGLLDPENLKTKLADCLQPLIEEVSQLQAKHPDLLADTDFVLEELAGLVDGRILPARSPEDQAKDRKWAQARIDANIPPGLKDKSKADGGIGDALIWREIIDLAKAANRPIIFVSDDQKEDWVLEVEGKKRGALPSLRQEMLTLSGQDFQHYNVQSFLTHVKDTEQPEVNETSIEEAATVRDQMNSVNDSFKAVTDAFNETITAVRSALANGTLKYYGTDDPPLESFDDRANLEALHAKHSRIQAHIATLYREMAAKQLIIDQSHEDLPLVNARLNDLTLEVRKKGKEANDLQRMIEILTRNNGAKHA
ncbi:PIN domain-containing protein [Paraburkholderia bannensis]|uniref:PIN domain-containing protein n=1 Tax=Paraburkholderia bannensis TaxID=765414 RepID=UPI002ABD2F85|nr:PIN domain-containing protein [Paraburkholderia bannensis]